MRQVTNDTKKKNTYKYILLYVAESSRWLLDRLRNTKINISGWDRWQHKRDVAKKVWISEIPAIKLLYHSLWVQIQIFKKKVSNFPKIRKKSPEKNSARRFNSKRRDSESWQTPIDKTNGCVMNSERAALVTGSDPHPLVTVFTARPVIRGGRRPGVWYKNIVHGCVENRRQKFSIPLQW